MSKTVLEALRKRNNLNTEFVEDVIFGCVTAIGEQGGNIAKTAAMYSRYNDKVGGVTVNRFCGSGLEAINQAAARIKSGFEDLLVAGGVESMSRIVMMSDGGAWAADPEVATLTYFVPQGISADMIATLNGYNREDVDKFALSSQQRAVQAYEENRFSKSLIPVTDVNGDLVLDKDEHLRVDTTLKGLGELKASFAKMGTDGGFDAVGIQKYPQLEAINHVHTAGNSSGIVDGAAALLIGTEQAGKDHKLTPRARIVATGNIATDPTLMLTGPVPAAQKALAKAGLKIEDIDLFEVNEAFASVVMNFME